MRRRSIITCQVALVLLAALIEELAYLGAFALLYYLIRTEPAKSDLPKSFEQIRPALDRLGYEMIGLLIALFGVAAGIDASLRLLDTSALRWLAGSAHELVQAQPIRRSYGTIAVGLYELDAFGKSVGVFAIGHGLAIMAVGYLMIRARALCKLLADVLRGTASQAKDSAPIVVALFVSPFVLGLYLHEFYYVPIDITSLEFGKYAVRSAISGLGKLAMVVGGWVMLGVAWAYVIALRAECRTIR